MIFTWVVNDSYKDEEKWILADIFIEAVHLNIQIDESICFHGFEYTKYSLI